MFLSIYITSALQACSISSLSHVCTYCPSSSRICYPPYRICLFSSFSSVFFPIYSAYMIQVTFFLQIYFQCFHSIIPSTDELVLCCFSFLILPLFFLLFSLPSPLPIFLSSHIGLHMFNNYASSIVSLNINSSHSQKYFGSFDEHSFQM